MSFRILQNISRQLFHTKSTTFVGATFLAICMIMLVAGLWPFNFKPVNKVSWLSDRNGVNFYGRAMITSPPLWDDPQKSPFQNKSITIELWVRPSSENSNVGIGRIVTLYDGQEPDVLFFGQWKSYLIIRSRTQNPAKKAFVDIDLRGAFSKGNEQFLTITSGNRKTSIYLNGKLAKTYPNHDILLDSAGLPYRFVLGGSPTGENNWTGYLSGLAVYSQTFTPVEVLKSYQEWMRGTTPSASRDNHGIALYRFDERKGTIAHNHLDAIGMLMIPEIFRPLKLTILRPPWSNFRLDRSLLLDVSINIIGFMPCGLFCAAFLFKMKRIRKNTIYLTSVLIGLGFSLTIELLQVYLPTRDSSLLDVICNVMGTIMGLILFHITVYPLSETIHE